MNAFRVHGVVQPAFVFFVAVHLIPYARIALGRRRVAGWVVGALLVLLG